MTTKAALQQLIFFDSTFVIVYPLFFINTICIILFVKPDVTHEKWTTHLAVIFFTRSWITNISSNINTKFLCFIYPLFSHINVCIILFEKPGVTQEEWTINTATSCQCSCLLQFSLHAGLWIWFCRNFLKLAGFVKMPVDVTGIGLITKNKVISSEGAVHDCMESVTTRSKKNW